ncbi:hypothetical protein ATCC90586_003434 [Pythium insidiosum]|nr:hypothetical protein ATCC90586_003434 [Pythium insidiosum]
MASARALSPAGLRVALVLILATRAACVAYYVAATQVYWRFTATTTAVLLPKYTTLLPVRYYRLVAVCHGAIGALHAALALRHVLVYSKTGTRPVQPVSVGPSLERVASTDSPMAPGKSAQSIIRRMAQSITRLNAARRAVFGVQGRFFDSIFLARELVETTLQTYQASRVDALLPRRWLPQAFIAVLVTNCWTTPLVYETLSSSLVSGRLLRRRVLCLLTDLLMDFASTIVVPTVVAWTYIAQLRPDSDDFPDQLWWDDVWLVQLVNESQLVLLTSVGDAVARLVFTLNLVVSIETITALLHADAAGAAKISPPLAVTASPEKQRATARALHRVGHLVMVVTGLAVVSLHLRAQARATDPACVLAVHPWFATQPACALLDVRCSRHDAAGASRSVVDDSLRRLDPAWLRYLVVRHCAAVEMPPRLQTFGRLVGIKVYNSTLARWDDSAALTQRHHSAIRFVFLVRTLLPNGTLPLGMLSPEYPPSLFDVELIATNVAWLPDVLAAIWPADMLLYLEHSAQLTTLPPVVPRLRLLSLSLAGSAIRRLPAALFESDIRVLLVGGTPLQELPADVDGARTTAIRELQFFHTNVSAAPEWLDAMLARGARVFAGGSPLCDRLSGGSAAAAARPALAALDCRRPPFSMTGEYPLVVDAD